VTCDLTLTTPFMSWCGLVPVSVHRPLLLLLSHSMMVRYSDYCYLAHELEIGVDVFTVSCYTEESLNEAEVKDNVCV
jgi:hypothetical protein